MKSRKANLCCFGIVYPFTRSPAICQKKPRRGAMFVEAQMFGRQRELDAALLSRSKREALETFQFLDWARHTSRYVSDVELHDFIARAFACVLDLNTHDKPTVRSYARRAELQIR